MSKIFKNMRFSFIPLFIYIITILAPTPVMADGIILPPPYYPVYETDQNAFIIYEDGIEILVLSVNFEGTADDFGWLIPVPNQPEVEKARADIFDDLAELTEQQQNLLEKILYPEEEYSTYGDGVGILESTDMMAPSADRSTVEVLEEKRVGIFDIAILTTEKVDDLEDWMDENGYVMPENTDSDNPFDYNYDYKNDDLLIPLPTPIPEERHSSGNALNQSRIILQEYIDSEWYFIAVKVNNTFIENGNEDIYNVRQINPIRITFETSDMIFPLKISSLSERAVSITLYTLTDSKYYVSNYDIAGCDEDGFYDDYYGSYVYQSENVCSDFEMTYGSTASTKEIEDLTKEIGKGSWFDSNSRMYLAKHYASYLSAEDMTSDVLFENQDNTRGLNNGKMTVVDWIKLPLAVVIYGPRNLLKSIFEGSGYYYGGEMTVVVALLIGLSFTSAISVVFWYFVLTKTRARILRILWYILQFPALWFLGLTIGIGTGVLIGLLGSFVGILTEAAIINAIIIGHQISIIVPVLFYRYQWRNKHTKATSTVKKKNKKK